MDDCEFWELAAVLGANRPPDTGQQGVSSSREWNAEQARRRELGLPQMEHAPPSPAAQAAAFDLMATVEQFGV